MENDVISINIFVSANGGGHKTIQSFRISYELFMKMKRKECSKLGKVYPVYEGRYHLSKIFKYTLKNNGTG